MNMWLVLLIMIPVILVMVFGKNPIREFQKEQRALVEKYGGDELTYAVSRNLEEQGAVDSSGKSILDAPTSNDMISSIKSVSKPVSTGEDLTIKKGGGANPNNRPVGANNLSGATQPRFTAPNISDTKPVSSKDDGFMFQPQAAGSGQYNAGLQPQPHDEGYYPTIISKDNSGNVATSSAQAGQKATLTGKEARLRSGQPVIFDGGYVYTVNAAGERLPMPDGDYVLENGSALKVSRGQSISQ